MIEQLALKQSLLLVIYALSIQDHSTDFKKMLKIYRGLEKEGTFQCIFCRSGFVNCSELIYHLIFDHFKESVFKIELIVCQTSFFRLNEWLNIEIIGSASLKIFLEWENN